MRVLLIEDDEKIGGFIAQGLRQEGHIVDWCREGEEGYHLAMEAPVDVAIVDVMLPAKDGLSVIRDLRSHGRKLPIIVLSARSDVQDRVAGLAAGADDYLTKPFSFAELSARLQALVRRSNGAQELATRLVYEDVVLDLLERKVTRGGRTIDLQPREFALLEFFLRRAGKVVSRTMILEQIWNYSFDPQTNVVEVLVSRLRSKLDREFSVKLIHTLRGVGYVLRKA